MSGRPHAVPLPPERMPAFRGGRPLKRWRYVGAFGEDVMLCVGFARIGPMPQAWWAVWDRTTAKLVERTTVGRGGVSLPHGRVLVRTPEVAMDLTYSERGRVETVSPHGAQYIWTAKAALELHGTLMLDGYPRPLALRGVIDDSAGYHARRTAWRWSAGVGRSADGRDVAWNFVDGVHDDPGVSERAVWVDGVAHHVEGSSEFAGDLGSVTTAGERLCFDEEATRTQDTDYLLAATTYEQPFGTFTGSLPVAGALATGFGVMERHVVRW